MRAAFTISLSESLTSAVFDELDGHGAEAGLPLVRWKLDNGPAGLVIVGTISRDDSHEVAARWVRALGMDDTSTVEDDGTRVWNSVAGPWKLTIIAREDD